MNKAKVILVLVGSVLAEIAQEIITYIADKGRVNTIGRLSGLPLIFVKEF